MKKISVLAATAGILVLTGCSTTSYNTNRSTNVATPTIAATDSIATVVVGERVTGQGCANSAYFGLKKFGDTKFLEVYGVAASSATERAKSSATYNALVGPNGLTDDIIVHPIWEISEEKEFFGWKDNVCAKVTGYRATIKGFTPANTITAPTPTEAKAGTRKRFFGLF